MGDSETGKSNLYLELDQDFTKRCMSIRSAYIWRAMPMAMSALFKMRVFWVESVWNAFSWIWTTSVKNSQANPRWQGIQLYFKAPFFPIFIPIKLSKVQMPILQYLEQLSYCSPSLPCPNWTSAARNCFSMRLVEVTACGSIVILETEHLIWGHDSADCYLQPSYLFTWDNGNASLPAMWKKFFMKTNKIIYLRV